MDRAAWAKESVLLNQRWQALKSERASWWEHWYELSEFLLPVNGRFFASDRNKGYKRYNAIYDNTGCEALNTLAAGMMSGMTSPSRPWFALTLSDKDLLAFEPVKVWLSRVTGKIEDVFAASNVYRVLHGMYEELGCFGTAAALIADDDRNVIHLQPFTIGEYALSTDWRGEATTLYREFQKPLAAVVAEFGYENLSFAWRNQFDRGSLDQWVTIVHAIEPRTDREASLPDAANMPWKSVYYDAAFRAKPLRISGFKSFPCVCPRWKTVGGDIYGLSPGMFALGDIKGLQNAEFRMQQGIDYQSNPPLQVPTSMKNRELEIFPGGISYYDATGPGAAIKTAFDVQLDLRGLMEKQQDCRQRINKAFYSDLFLMISQQPANGAMTATEVAARNEEKMLMLGPVVERLSNELLAPLIETTFQRLLTAGLLPPAPPELSGHALNIEYVSILAQAQKAVAVSGVDRFIQSVGQIAQLQPAALDKLNGDEVLDYLADKLGVDPRLINSDKQTAVIRQQRQQQQEQAQKMALLEQGANIASKAGGISTQPGSAAGDLLQQMRGRAA
jgi:hypothetical protein